MCRLCEILKDSIEGFKLLCEEKKYKIYEDKSGDLILVYKLHDILPSGQETQEMGQRLFRIKDFNVSGWYTDYAKTLGEDHFHCFLRKAKEG